MVFKKRLIPYSIPQIEVDSFSNQIRNLFNGCIYRGSDIGRLEKEVAKYIGVRYAICFSSARYALFLLYKFFDCKNKKVVLPAYTCIPAINAAMWAGAEPIFVDIDLNTYNPVFNESLLKLENIGAICLSYLYGLIGDLDQFLEFGKEHKIPIIEDAAIAIGASYRGRKVGSLGDAAVFSLQNSKILTGWKGGIITTDNETLHQFLCKERKKQLNPPSSKLLFNIFFTYLRTLFSNSRIYGFTMYPIKRLVFSRTLNKIFKVIIDQNPTEAITGDSPEVLPIFETFRFTNIQASIAFSSFKRIDSIVEERKHYAELISNQLKNVNTIKIPAENEKVRHAYGRYPVRIPGYSKFDLEKYFLEYGIEIALNYPYICPNTPHIKRYNFNELDYPNALIASRETFLLPFHTFMKEEDIFVMTNSLKKIISSLF